MLLKVTSQIVSNVLSALLAVLITRLIAHSVTPAEFGQFSFAMSLCLIAAVVIDGGNSFQLFRYSTDSSQEEKISLVRPIIFGITALILFSTVFHLFFSNSLLQSAIIYVFLLTIFNFLGSVWKGKGKFEVEAAIRLLTKLSLFLAALISFNFTDDLVVLFTSWSLVLFLILVAGTLSSPGKKYFTFQTTQRSTPTSKNLFIVEVTSTIYRRADVIILSLFESPEIVGLYAVCSRIFEALILALAPLAQTLFYKYRKKKEFISTNKLYIPILVAILGGLGIWQLISYSSELIVITLFGENYRFAIDLLRQYGFIFVFVLPNYLLTQFALLMNYDRHYAIVTSLCATFSIAFFTFLINKMGVDGAVFGAIATEMMLSLLLLVLVSHNTRSTK